MSGHLIAFLLVCGFLSPLAIGIYPYAQRWLAFRALQHPQLHAPTLVQYDSQYMLDPTSDETLDRWLNEAPASESILEFAERVGHMEHLFRAQRALEARVIEQQRVAQQARDDEEAYWYHARLEAEANETPGQKAKREARQMVQVQQVYLASSASWHSGTLYGRAYDGGLPEPWISVP